MAKLTKKEAHNQRWSGENIAASTADLLKNTMRMMSVENGSDKLTTAGEENKLVVGLPAPSLAFEYLLQNSVYPLQRLTQVVGCEGSNKSAFGFEVVRWARKLGGLGSLFETEKKYSADYAASIIGWNDIDNAMGLFKCDDMEEWQSMILGFLDNMKKAMTGTKEKPGSGKTFPIVILVDSLMGTLSRDTSANIDKVGFAERRFAIEAMKLTDYLKKLSVEMSGWPVLGIMVNHLKMSKDERGRPIRGRAGGNQLKFGETFELEFTKRGIHHTVYADRKEQIINIKCFKNSLGDTGRDIDVPIVWWNEPDPESGLMRQHTIWDWHASTVDLLLSLEEPGVSRAIKDIVRITRVNSGGIKAWSNDLGIPESDPQSYHEVGKAICANKEMRGALRNLFGIKVRKAFRKGMDYGEQMAAEIAAAESKVEEAEANPDEVIGLDETGEVVTELSEEQGAKRRKRRAPE